MMVSERVKQVMLLLVILLSTGITAEVYSYEMTFTFKGRLDVDSGRGITCEPFDVSALEYPFTLIFKISSDALPDDFGPYMTDMYFVDGREVEFLIGETPYPVTDLIFEIGQDYIGIWLDEYDGLLVEYQWTGAGLYSGGTLKSLCPPPGTVMAQPTSVYWSDFDCYGYVLYTWFKITCELPSWETPDILMYPKETLRPATVQN